MFKIVDVLACFINRMPPKEDVTVSAINISAAKIVRVLNEQWEHTRPIDITKALEHANLTVGEPGGYVPKSRVANLEECAKNAKRDAAIVASVMKEIQTMTKLYEMEVDAKEKSGMKKNIDRLITACIPKGTHLYPQLSNGLEMALMTYALRHSEYK